MEAALAALWQALTTGGSYVMIGGMKYEYDSRIRAFQQFYR